MTNNNGGKSSDSAHRPESHPSLNINTKLYPGIKIPRPGSPAFLSSLHREIIINTAIVRHAIIRIVASQPRNAPKTVLIHIIASGLMFPVIAAH